MQDELPPLQEVNQSWVQGGAHVVVDQVVSTLHLNTPFVANLKQNATNEVVDNEATNDNQSFDNQSFDTQVVNVLDDTRAINIQDELMQAIDGPLSNRLNETTPSKPSLPTNHDTQQVVHISTTPITQSSWME
jgi:hypothetical protein